MSEERRWTERELRGALDRYETELRAAGKARNTVAWYVGHPERFLNWLVRTSRTSPVGDPRAITKRTEVDDMDKAVPWNSQYRPLFDHLSAQAGPLLPLSFTTIERVLGRPLPASARRYRQWWENEREGTHGHARAWRDAGYRTRNVDFTAGTVEFFRGPRAGDNPCCHVRRTRIPHRWCLGQGATTEHSVPNATLRQDSGTESAGRPRSADVVDRQHELG